ncbi:tyrosine-type recombinase/integrase [Haloferax sp. YSSS75]|uniref:tyrosine-type recombinase/integrase n=1 Tax=Haloferax sp. YSSS75 TaxID=3388564 RepID=UPI00398C8EB4
MNSGDDGLEEIATAFGRDTDPLQEYESRFHQVDADPLYAYIERVQIPKDASESTLKNYHHSFDQWQNFMAGVGRHFACPNDTHVKQFMRYLSDERDNSASTIQQKVRNINRAYEWWQEHHAFPHPMDYNPFRIALRETDLNGGEEKKKHPPLSVEDLRGVISGCTNVRERLFLVWQLKLGLRVGELLNIRLEDIALSHAEIEKWYPEMGSADPLQGYSDAVYIPSRYKREGNKSHRPRILPLDDEAKQVLLHYLPTRPTADTQWLILSQRTFGKIVRGDRVNEIWKHHFATHNESDRYRNITSHYGRYFFTNYWKVHQDLPRELVQYMRGDKLGEYSGEAIDEYLSAYFTDIRDHYLNYIFKVF